MPKASLNKPINDNVSAIFDKKSLY
jgi:hypothetical protein